MKPRAEKPHPKKLENQELKAARLTLAIEDLAEASKMSPLEVFGRTRTDEQWIRLLMIADPLVLAGKRKAKAPSSETQLIILGLLRERGKGAAA